MSKLLETFIKVGTSVSDDYVNRFSLDSFLSKAYPHALKITSEGTPVLLTISPRARADRWTDAGQIVHGRIGEIIPCKAMVDDNELLYIMTMVHNLNHQYVKFHIASPDV